MRKIAIGYVIAALFWFIMFSPWTAQSVNFWVVMMAATASLVAYSFVMGKASIKEIYRWEWKWAAIGIIAAAALYALFFIGNEVSRLIFDFTDSQVNSIYSTKSQADKIFIGAALFLWIGPSEEIFWRGFAQHELSKIKSPAYSLIATTIIYALVHIWAFNFMLFMAALICGIFWGWMFYKYNNVWPGLISHAVWDLFIFIIIPIS